LDLIQHNDLQPEERAKLENQPIDEEKPGLGQHVCLVINIDRCRTALTVSLFISMPQYCVECAK
jgi:bud site selection protein 20